MSLGKTLYPLLSTGTAQEDRKIVDWYVKQQNRDKQTHLLIIIIASGT